MRNILFTRYQAKIPSKFPFLIITKKLAMQTSIDVSPNILLTNIDAFAGTSIGVDVIEKKERFHIPGIKGTLVAFHIKGNSMSPTIKAGDMVICSPIESLKELKINQVYAVVTSQTVWVKRVQPILNISNHPTHLNLISDNHLEYDPFTVDLKVVKKIFQVKLKLTGV